jgi:carboxylesterase type B
MFQDVSVDFARSGGPSGEESHKWPAFTPETERAMVLDVTPRVGPTPNRVRFKALEADFARRRERAKP